MKTMIISSSPNKIGLTNSCVDICIACAGGSGDGTENTLHSMKNLAKFLHTEVVDYIGITKKNFENEKERIAESAKNLLKSKI